MVPSGPDVPDNVFALYRYYPSLAAAVLFVLLFIFATCLQLYQLVRTRAWSMIPLLVGGFFEWIGYIGRATSAQQTPEYTLMPYVIQSILLLVAPALFAATIYMELGRIILLVDGEGRSMISVKWLTKIFVLGDVLSFLMQGSGGGIMIKSMQTGENIIIGGLVLQVIFFGLFVIVALCFHYRVSRSPTERVRCSFLPWKTHLAVLYISSGLILVRSIFRLVEYAQGNAGYLLKHECFLYVFDSILMLGVMVVFTIVHPSEINALLKGGKASKKGGLEIQFLAQA